MKQGKRIAFLLVVLALLVFGMVRFNSYVDEKVYQESTDRLHDTYSQVANTLQLFSSTNWSALSDWDLSLSHAARSGESQEILEEFAKSKASWNYNDFYLFNEQNDYLTISGQVGNLDSLSSSLGEVFSGNQHVVSSYIAPNGVRRIVFAIPLTQTFSKDGVTYTAAAVTYDNSYVQTLLTENVYSGQSDCYLVRSDGSVVFSLEEKTLFPEFITNMPEFLQQNCEFTQGSGPDLASCLSSRQSDNALVSKGGQLFYVLCQPAWVSDWSIVAVVNSNAVESTLRGVQRNSVLFSALILGVFALVVVLLVVRNAKARLRAKELERQIAEHEKHLVNQLFEGITEIVDRFALVDLVSDTYEYHERKLGMPLYPKHGRYSDLLATVARRYVGASGEGEAKVGSLLTPEHLRKVLLKPGDQFRFEYMLRNGSEYKMMNVIPVEWSENGKLEKVLLVALDVGQKKELEALANTDGLTGLFNERYFSNVLHGKEDAKKPFVLYYLDLDRFKPVNDTYGHDVGDELLKQVALRLQSCIRVTDYAFRIGGDEFIVVVSEGFDEQRCENMVQRIKQQISEPYRIEGHSISVGTSCAYAAYPEDSNRVAEVRKLADARMYADKKANAAGR